MSSKEFSVKCHNCGGEVTGWTQSISYSLAPTQSIQGPQTLYLLCGCVIDFPDWQVNLETGHCKILDFTGNLFIEFDDEEMIWEED